MVVLEPVLDFLLAVKNILVAFFFSWLRFLIPPRRKCVRGEVVLITGAGHGLGRGMAVEFTKLGAVVVGWDINKKGLDDTLSVVEETGGEFCPYVCDVSDRDQIKAVAQRVREDVGEVSILVNCAGVVSGKKLLDLEDEEIEETFNVNLFGPIWTTKEFLPSMLENNHGHVVNMASSLGHIGLCQLVDYSASKFGVVGFTQTLEFELHFSGHDGVYTTLASPSFVKTGMFEGCEMLYPLILPSLEPQATVDRIMQAILTNQKELCIPRLVYVMAALKCIMPVSAMHEIIQFFKAHKFMDNFIRGKRTTTPIGAEE